MKTHFRTLWAGLALGMAALKTVTAQSQPADTNASLVAVGAISDPAGDASIGSVDITSASVSVYSSGIATFAVTFAPGASLGSASTQFELDTDQNPATGYPGRDGDNDDQDLIGGDVFINIYGSNFQSNAVLYSGSFTYMGSFPVDYSGNTVQVSVPLATLGCSNGLMNFAVTASQELTDYSSTTISDFAPDLGDAVGVVAPVGAIVGTGAASRSMPSTYTSGTTFSVSIAVTPSAAVQSFSVKDMPPANWTVSNISSSGAFDSVSGTVRWGPFAGNGPRTLTYTVTPATTVGAAAKFSGTATFDSVTVPIGGQQTISAGSAPPPGTGTQAPSWALPGINGTTVYSTNYLGKVVLLNFWATWCGPCVGEIPDLIALEQKYGPDGLVVVGISIDDNGSTPPTSLLQAFASAHGVNYPMVMSRPNGRNVESAYGGISAIPQTFIMDRQNNIARTFIGSQSYATYEQAVEPLLNAAPALGTSFSNGQLRVSWPSTQAQFTLESTRDPASGVWAAVQIVVQSDGSSQYVNLPTDGTKQFFRLKSQ